MNGFDLSFVFSKFTAFTSELFWLLLVIFGGLRLSAILVKLNDFSVTVCVGHTLCGTLYTFGFSFAEFSILSEDSCGLPVGTAVASGEI